MRNVLLLLSCFFLYGCAAGSYVCKRVLTPERDGTDLVKTRAWAMEKYPELKVWLDSVEQNDILRDTSIITPDGLRKHAFYMPATEPSPKTVLILHGYLSTPYKMMMLANLYREKFGYNVLLPHLEYHGLSEGEAIQMGWKDREDVIAWSEFAHGLFKDTLQVMHGISMGGASVMMVSGHKDLPEYVRGFVEDCGYTTVWDEYKYQMKQMFHLPAWPLLYSTNAVCKRKYGWDFHEASCLSELPKATAPMLFIHGGADDFTPVAMVYENFAAKTQGYRELLIIEGATHAMSFHKNPQKYSSVLERFLANQVEGTDSL